ncbi:hypothetical protein AEAC466_21440 [Asticcacaulis sp. AC466]|nr:hypothetical protein AEAC466_21440 [Asticcacaulis sp. AC466]
MHLYLIAGYTYNSLGGVEVLRAAKMKHNDVAARGDFFENSPLYCIDGNRG